MSTVLEQSTWNVFEASFSCKQQEQSHCNTIPRAITEAKDHSEQISDAEALQLQWNVEPTTAICSYCQESQARRNDRKRATRHDI
jgi:hypothetical protein